MKSFEWLGELILSGSLPLPAEPAAMKAALPQDPVGMQATLQEMTVRMDRLALVTRALFELLSEKAGVTERDLARKIAEVDARDGVVDGRMTTPAKPCPACGGMMSPKFNRCLFCGHRDLAGDPFNPVK